MSNLTEKKDLLDVTTRLLGLGLVLVYVIGLLITNIYFSRFGISDFSMLRVRYLTTGFAFLGFSLLPLMVLIVPIVAFYFLRNRHIILSLSASFLAFLIFAFTAYWLLWFAVIDNSLHAPFYLYAVEGHGALNALQTGVKYLLRWFTPIALPIFVYAPLAAIFITWLTRKLQKTALVVCIPLALLGVGSVLSRFAWGHYPQLNAGFGGPTAMVSDVVVEAAACSQLSIELEGDGKICKLRGIALLHETDKRIYAKLPGGDGPVLQIPLTHVRVIATPKLPQ